MQMFIRLLCICLFVLLSQLACHTNTNSHQDVFDILEKLRRSSFNADNSFSPQARLAFCDSVLSHSPSALQQISFGYFRAKSLLQLGEEEKAIVTLNQLLNRNDCTANEIKMIRNELALANLRLGEQINCISNHAAESCIVPVKGLGIHKDTKAAENAKALYLQLLNDDPNDLESRWLYNIACMVLGEYPDKVNAKWFLPDMNGDTTFKVEPFFDIAGDLKIDVNNMAGGSIADDFNNDGYLDLITSSSDLNEGMHYFRNLANGEFLDSSVPSGLSQITGGLNLLQTDFNNDGNLDIFVLRGAWRGRFGKEPNSLLQNNGDGTFTDVTVSAGLLSFHPTQTATWNDFNNDGWIDVFIGNETNTDAHAERHPCELYINNQDGTFTNRAKEAKCDIVGFVKGVTSGDYDNDGKKDIYLSLMEGNNVLLRNTGHAGECEFENVTHQAGLDKDGSNTFVTWFWDYNNDGWLDLFVCDYTFDRALAYYAAAEKLGIPAGSKDKMFLYRNNHNGTFTNVAMEAGLNKMVFAMGSNFGDIDNDGFLDMYLGTGHPDFRSVVPNKMFKNVNGNNFADVTTSAHVGHLQKGHGVSFADLDNDGDQDIYIDMGGVYKGDSYQNSFFLNPGQGSNSWISIQLEGVDANRMAIGSKLKITLTENGVKRHIYRDVNSGGSFGASPLRREIGLGQAKQIDELEIQWHGNGKVQVFKNIKSNQFLKITEGTDEIMLADLHTITWTLPDKICIPPRRLVGF